MIFMKLRKYYFYDPTAEILQLLYTLFHYCILIDTLVPLIVIMLCMTTLAISHLSSSQDGNLDNCKMKHLPKSVSLQNLAQYPNNTRSRIIKRRRYIEQKYSFTRYRFKVSLLGVAIPHSFISCAATQYKAPAFDSDSHQIGVYNHSSYSISNNLEHFISPITPFNFMLLGVNGKSKVPGTGIVRCLIDDDSRFQSKIVLQNTLYIPTSPICLLSPRHWDQCANDHFPNSEGIWCDTYSNKIVLHWSQ